MFILKKLKKISKTIKNLTILICSFRKVKLFMGKFYNYKKFTTLLSQIQLSFHGFKKKSHSFLISFKIKIQQAKFLSHLKVKIQG